MLFTAMADLLVSLWKNNMLDTSAMGSQYFLLDTTNLSERAR